MLKMGAVPIESAGDVFDAVPLLAEDAVATPGGGEGERTGTDLNLSQRAAPCGDRPDLSRVYRALSSGATDIDALACHLDKDVSEVQCALLELEVRGLVGRDLAGCYYKLK